MSAPSDDGYPPDAGWCICCGYVLDEDFPYYGHCPRCNAQQGGPDEENES